MRAATLRLALTEAERSRERGVSASGSWWSRTARDDGEAADSFARRRAPIIHNPASAISLRSAQGDRVGLLIRFAHDSALEGSGFEPSVPLKDSADRSCWRGNRRRGRNDRSLRGDRWFGSAFVRL